MTNESIPPSGGPDPAAVFVVAKSLWDAAHLQASADRFDLSDCFNGVDQLMREVMRIATLFEAWAGEHVAFEELSELWPYLLEAHFGEACAGLLRLSAWAGFGREDCLRVALKLGLPVRVGEGDSVIPPVDVTAPNPVPGRGFRAFRLQTVRTRLADNEVEPFTAADEPFDEAFGPPYFALYGIGEDGLDEQLAERESYAAMLELVRKLAPGVAFPERPASVTRRGPAAL